MVIVLDLPYLANYHLYEATKKEKRHVLRPLTKKLVDSDTDLPEERYASLEV